MPIYEFKDNETNEVHDVMLKISEYDQYLNDNPNMKRVYTVAPALTSGHKSARQIAGSDWNDHLKRIKAGAGKNNTIKT
jgi:hypothetical protein